MNTLMACLSQSLVRKRTHDGEFGWSCSSKDEGFIFNGLNLNLGIYDKGCQWKTQKRRCIEKDWILIQSHVSLDQENKEFAICNGAESGKIEKRDLGANGIIDLNLDQALISDENMVDADDRGMVDADDRGLVEVSLEGLSDMGESGKQREGEQGVNLSASGIIDDDEVLPFLSLGLGINAVEVKVSEIGKRSEKERFGNLGVNGIDLNLGQALKNSYGKPVDDDRNSIKVHAVDEEVFPFLSLGLGINAVGVKVSVSGERSEESQFGNLDAKGIDLNLDLAQNCESLGKNEILIADDDQDVTVQNLDTSCVRAWLSQLGFSEYATMFKYHGVDDEVLPFLSFEDLKDMGISAVGTRRKMYGSIKRLAEGLQLWWREK